MDTLRVVVIEHYKIDGQDEPVRSVSDIFERTHISKANMLKYVKRMLASKRLKSEQSGVANDPIVTLELYKVGDENPIYQKEWKVPLLYEG